MEEVRKNTVLELMYDLLRGNGDKETINRLLEEGNKTKLEQDTQGDWAKIDKFTYWDGTENKGLTKEQWAKLKYGNIRKKGKTGYVNWTCRICGEAEESIEHIWECETARDKIKEQWVREIDD